jgi:hypothetical protein
MLRFSAEGFRDWECDGCGAWGGEEERAGASRGTASGREGKGGGVGVESGEEAGGGRGVGDLEWRWMHRLVHWAMGM